ncbi:transglutaminase-like domain-containing protein [Dehalobacter sp. 14DCB1]|uniref:transglutaminase domain-containing protein n=1 Tax=Dehalobacter sp. 14DCB1 TaxID=2070227 RepID=UPI00037F460A|nr:transglutaminase-like domain-containing protein [Dehalobacter sp. 14DCB1]TCX48561.1 transglutaminase domain-containing protein [Dehalobacter sp. 14DCB1]
MQRKLSLKVISVVLAALMFITLSTTKAEAAYNVAFQTDTIQVTSPSVSGTQYDRSFTIEGTSTLSKIWLCLRGPNGEITTVPVSVNQGVFSKVIWLRFGAGLYTIWVGDNGKQFDGSIRFEVQNTSTENYFCLTPSGFVNSDNPTIKNLAASLTKTCTTDMDKVIAIHSWVTKNIAYDTNAYYSGNIGVNTATDVIRSKKGTCRDYSFAFTALARAAGVQTRVVYGDAWSSSQQAYEKHAWNEALVDGEWISIDTTWDAGYIKNKKFVTASTTKYLNMDAGTFAKTHKNTSVTLY